MRVISCNVGKPVLVSSSRGDVLTAIFKAPVDGPVKVRRLNLDGDRQDGKLVVGLANGEVVALAVQ